MVLLIDNYDSFSYNLYQLVGSIESDIKVIRNDAMTVEEQMSQLRFDAPAVERLGIPEYNWWNEGIHGATVTYAKRLMHGKQSVCTIKKNADIFKGLGEKIEVARYHSLAAKEETLPETLEIIAVSDDDGEVMAVKHRDYQLYGLQFHPESILTPEGMTMLKNFIDL